MILMMFFIVGGVVILAGCDRIKRGLADRIAMSRFNTGE